MKHQIPGDIDVRTDDGDVAFTDGTVDSLRNAFINTNSINFEALTEAFSVYLSNVNSKQTRSFYACFKKWLDDREKYGNPCPLNREALEWLTENKRKDMGAPARKQD